MGSKNISIPEDVYEKLREERRGDESFGETIDRLLGRRPLSEFWGDWSGDTTARARNAIEAGRERNADRLDRLYD
ncbi:antitoxin VapB family protein [Haloplanus natans]|uniref:antitoxin VapB family protein n=1 Tax=Haloplanus natans TaxID=376171 RepID=UPI00067788D6|nr:antitoxin VapB family protein [Haloplanus natans]